MIDTLSSPDDEAETVGSLLYISDLIAERQKKYFPDLKKWIVDYELTISDGNIRSNEDLTNTENLYFNGEFSRRCYTGFS